MLNQYFTTQNQKILETKRRLERLNETLNKQVKQPSTFKTNYTFHNQFFKYIETLKTPETPEKDAINPSIKTIHYVYQYSFVNVNKTTGFGDFIRGCLFLLEFCEKHNLKYNFHIKNHNIKKYLKHFENKPEIDTRISSHISKYLHLNAYFTCVKNIIDYVVTLNDEKRFIYYVNTQPNYSGNIFINTTNFPRHYISNENRAIMRSLLEPCDEVHNEVEEYLSKLQLLDKSFVTYHIRLGDSFLQNSDQIVNLQIVQYIINNMKNTNQPFLLITDCSPLKRIILSYYPNMKCIFFDISHTCDNNITSIKNTLVEFYMMAQSRTILSMSVYPHGSGFSKWCSVVYNIPYICKLIPKII
jgi:hypothetical protein